MRFEEDFVFLLLELLMVFFWVSKRPSNFGLGDNVFFQFSLALFGYIMEIGQKPFSSNSFFLFFSLFLLVCLSNGALTSFIVVFQFTDRCDLKSSRLKIWIWSRLTKLAVILSVCVVRVGSDVFESARLMLRVDSLQLESARLALHTLTSSGRVGSLEFESARATYHNSVILVESALGPSGRLEYLCVLNFLGRAMIESALLSFESARVHKFRKTEFTTRFNLARLT